MMTTGSTCRRCQRATCPKEVKMVAIGRFGTLTITEHDGKLIVRKNGDTIFDGMAEEFTDVLERHKKFMDYIDAQEG